MFCLLLSVWSSLLSFFRYFCPSKVISLAVSKVRPPRKPMSFFPLYLGVDPSELVALHLPIAYDETPRHIAICNDNYKFTALPYSILQEFAAVMK